MLETVLGRVSPGRRPLGGGTGLDRRWRRLIVLPILLAFLTAACEDITYPERVPTDTPAPSGGDGSDDVAAPDAPSTPDNGDTDDGTDSGSGDTDSGGTDNGDTGDGTDTGDNPADGADPEVPGTPEEGTPPPAVGLPAPADPNPPAPPSVDPQPGIPSAADPPPAADPAPADDPPPLEGRPGLPFPTEPAPSPDPTPPTTPPTTQPPTTPPPPDPGPVDPGVGNLPAWSNPSSWPGGSVPAAGASVTIPAGTKIRVDQDVQVGGITVAGELYFDPSRSVTVRSNANIVVTGKLHMRPTSPSIDHTIEFTGVNESRFVGGGMQVIAADVGLWVMHAGQLNLEGSARRGWTNVNGAVAAGARSISVDDATGWQVGDRVLLTPTAAPGSDGVNGENSGGFHETTIAAISGNNVTLAQGPARAHPLVAGRYSAELANLTRNVEIRGTSAGNSHMMIHAMMNPQFIRWVSFDRMGVRGALGRYPVHFHHSGGAGGSLVEGVVTTRSEHHAIVPHESHGITMRDIVAYDTSGGDAIWWDEGDETSDLLLDRVLVAASANSAFYLGRGTNMTVRNSVAVGVRNSATDGGFEWENGAVGTWTVEDIVAHNNIASGARVWQNSSIPQIVDGFVAYHNYAAAIDHGAYSNRYVYRDGHYYGNREAGIILWATSEPLPIGFENTIVDSAGITQGPHVLVGGSAVPAPMPVLMSDVEFRGNTPGAVVAFTAPDRAQIRCVDCTFPQGSELVSFSGGVGQGTWLDVINNGSSTRYRSNGSSSIERPGPSVVGSGTGLTAEYFDNPNLTGLDYTTILPGLTEEWELDPQNPSFGVLPAHHTLSVGDGSSARLSGQFEVAPGDGGQHTFTTSFNGGLRFWIDGQLIIDDWTNSNLDAGGSGPGNNRASINLSPGRHEIKIELRDTNSGSGWRGWFFDVMLDAPGHNGEVVPASQLYPTRVPNNDPRPSSP